jgi:hypothetical protein
MIDISLLIVMPGLVPGIHVLAKNDVDGRLKPGHGGGEAECR